MKSEDPIWKSDISYIMLVIYGCIGGGIFIIAGNNNDFPQDIFKGPYIPLDNWITLSVLLVVLIPVLCGVFKFLVPRYTLYEDRFVIQRNYAGEVSLPISELQNWQYRPSGGSRSIYSTYLVLVFKEKTIRLEENSISSLAELAEMLRQKHPQLETSSKTFNTVINAFINILYLAACFCPLFILAFWVSEYNESKTLNKKHLLLKLSGDPEFIEHTHKRSESSYVMVLRSSDIGNFDLTFNLSKVSKKEEYMNHLHRGDTIPMDILQYDYDVKVSKKREPNFWDKHVGWYQIPIYEFWYNKDTETH